MNNDYVNLTSVGTYAMVLFKNTGTAQTPVTISWVGKSTRATTLSTAYLQIFNRTSSTWETLAADNITPADVDFVLTGTKASNLGNYYDGSFVISARMYQQAA